MAGANLRKITDTGVLKASIFCQEEWQDPSRGRHGQEQQEQQERQEQRQGPLG